MPRNLFLVLALSTFAHAGIDLRLPTENHHLFDDPAKFYMYVDRDFEGVKSKPWQAGSYGFVRTECRFGEQVVCVKFHEGIDISPVNRDKVGNPLDMISSIADGRVFTYGAEGRLSCWKLESGEAFPRSFR
mgnify:CR=1 FL=1